MLSPFVPPRGYHVDELEAHISKLHEYNDIKDVGQMLLGKLGEQRPRCPWDNGTAASSGLRVCFWAS